MDDDPVVSPSTTPSLADLIRTGEVPEVLPGVFGCRIPRDPDPARPARGRRQGLYHLFAMPHQDSLATDSMLSLCHQLTIVPTQNRVEVLEAPETGGPATALIAQLHEVCLLYLRHHGRHLLGE